MLDRHIVCYKSQIDAAEKYLNAIRYKQYRSNIMFLLFLFGMFIFVAINLISFTMRSTN